METLVAELEQRLERVNVGYRAAELDIENAKRRFDLVVSLRHSLMEAVRHIRKYQRECGHVVPTEAE
jgi:hypothetical protein